MSITVKSVFHDTENFFRNKFITFLVIALSCTFITLILNYAFSPSKEQIALLNKSNDLKDNIGFFELIQNMTSEQQQILMLTSVASIISSLIGNTLLAGGVLLSIQLILSDHRINTMHTIISVSASSLPRLLILIFLTTILVQVGIMLLIIPGILLAIVLAFSPIIIVQNEIGIINAIHSSARLACENLYLVAPAILSWLLAKTFLMLFTPIIIAIIPNIGIVLSNTLSNLISAILLVYLFRLYMLINH